jgi:hypothetical protein
VGAEPDEAEHRLGSFGPFGWDDGRWNADEEQACDHNAETVEEDLTTTEARHD